MGQVFQSQNPGTQFSYFQDYVALKWTNIHKKSSILEEYLQNSWISSWKTNLIILINNFKYTGHEACQTDESGKFLIVEVYLRIH